MKVVGLLSGGKDSCYNLCHAAKQGHTLVAVATLAPPAGKDELDSYMYQTVGHDAVHLVAQALDVPLYRHVIAGSALNQSSSYGSRLPSASGSSSEAAADETEDLLLLLQQVKRAHPDAEAVSVGAILSNYQRVRVEHVCLRSGMRLLPLAYLWQRDQRELLREMCEADVRAVLIKVAGIGLDERHLGKTLAQVRPTLERLNDRYGSHICGEGGEYETLTLDCPLFKKRIILDEVETVLHADSSFASVSYLRVKRAHLEDKEAGATTLADVKVPPMLDWLGESTRAAAAAALESSVPENVQLSQAAPDSATAPSGMTVAQRGAWVAVGNVTASCCGSASGSLSFEEEVCSAFARLSDALAAHHLSLAHLAHLNLSLASQADFAPLNALYARLFGSDPPSRACIALDDVPGGARVTIDAVAMDDGVRYADGVPQGKPNRERRVTHVQGRSYWAAANIGPYSQAVKADGRIFIAGQIGLVPTTLELADDEATQIALSLQHARRVFHVALEMRAATQRGWIEGCICWLESPAPGAEAQAGRRLEAARDAWQEQDPFVRGDENDEEHEPSWNAQWLGADFAVDQMPTVFAFLPHKALPRGACVEWQLTGHDGTRSHDAAPDEDADKFGYDDDDDDEEEPGPVRGGGSIRLPSGLDVTYCYISARGGTASFGLAFMNLTPATSKYALIPKDSALPKVFTAAPSVRVLYRADIAWSEVQAAVNGLLSCSAGSRPSPPALTPMPVCGLYGKSGSESCDVVLAWTGL